MAFWENLQTREFRDSIQAILYFPYNCLDISYLFAKV